MLSCTYVREPAQQHWPWLKKSAKWDCSTASSTANANTHELERLKNVRNQILLSYFFNPRLYDFHSSVDERYFFCKCLGVQTCFHFIGKNI